MIRRLITVILVLTLGGIGTALAVDSVWWMPYRDDAQTLGLWHFDDVNDPNHPNFADDDSAHSTRNNDGTRVVWTTSIIQSGAGKGAGAGNFGNALRGDGSAWGHVVAYDATDMNFGSSFTIEAWIEPSSSDVYGIKGIANKGGSSGFDFGLSDGKLYVDTRTYVYEYGVGNTVLQPYTWYHVAAVFAANLTDGWKDHVLFYINGKLDADLGYPPFDGDWAHNTAPLAIGVLDNTENTYSAFVGAIDEVRYSNGIRTYRPLPCGGWGVRDGDINKDCYVDFKDVAVIAGKWLD